MRKEKWVILKEVTLHVLSYVVDISDIAECTADGELLLFNSDDEAAEFQERHSVNGKIIQLPVI